MNHSERYYCLDYRGHCHGENPDSSVFISILGLWDSQSEWSTINIDISTIQHPTSSRSSDQPNRIFSVRIFKQSDTSQMEARLINLVTRISEESPSSVEAADLEEVCPLTRAMMVGTEYVSSPDTRSTEVLFDSSKFDSCLYHMLLQIIRIKIRYHFIITSR